jgi:hypothetical protein
MGELSGRAVVHALEKIHDMHEREQRAKIAKSEHHAIEAGEP